MYIVELLNDYLWTYVVVTLLVCCAFYFSVRMRMPQLRMFGTMVRSLLTANKSASKGSISSFQAFAVSLASRVGTGNLAGVASAIFIGGPGAVFWMWVMALLGAATAFVESTLAQLYKRRGPKGFFGGPAYYMESGLRCRWMGIVFAILITITFALANQIVQSNTICDAVSDAFSVDKKMVGICISLMTMVIIFGGIKRISRVTSVLVPVMAVGYVALTLYVIVANIAEVPSVLALIVKSAFGFEQAAGGAVGIGVTVLQGVKRGLFSNEAGEGSAPNAAATADVAHPVVQGFVQSLGVFADTLLICTCTALMILLSGLYTQGYDGIILTTRAIESEVGSVGSFYVVVAIFLFVYSTIIANYYYGEANIRFVTSSPNAIFALRLITGVVVFVGSYVTLQTAWSVVDICMGVMTCVNLVAIVLLAPKAFVLLRDYECQLRAGDEPRFSASDVFPGEKFEGWEVKD